ncbi:MAG: tRNA (N(6)-L-threonylcarbamoyladenosine(37)-C(2))-methylthiotransferase MtaB [Bacteroidaceae bacterium]|nr:tRNA (N(6)-L-threonylcarbamoyladenosine(37)-C(2))-methylthiotransferase MtaB [Bacteroidaceae bacterium]
MIDTSLYKDKKAIYYTLGCKLNFSETASIERQLQEAGIRTARRGECADICIINSCAVTQEAEKKCRQAIHKLIRQHPGAFIIVTGCYAQLSAEKLANEEGVDVVLGIDKKGDILEHLGDLNKREGAGDWFVQPTKDVRRFVPSCSRGDRTRYFLKVQDGCDYFCTYCTIPYARGRSRNPQITDLVAQAQKAADEGGREIVITGVNIGDFGKSTGESFMSLVKALDAVEGIERYRISSIEPNLITDEIIEYMAQSRSFMPHLHIPLQAGSDEVLKLMHRRYDTAFFAEKIATVRRIMPDAFIGVDVIVGTRGESDELFEKAYEFIKGLDITQLHVFSYSERPGTQALKIEGSVSPAEKHRRSHMLIELSEEKRIKFYERFRGKEATVLFEKPRLGMPMGGFTENYIRVEMPCDKNLINKTVRVRLGDFNDDKSALTIDEVFTTE